MINALTYLASQLSLVWIPSLGPDRVVGMPTLRNLIADVALGYRHLWGDLGMRAQAFVAFSFNIFGFGGYAILIPFLKKGFDATDQQVGIFLRHLGAWRGRRRVARGALPRPLAIWTRPRRRLRARRTLFLPVVLVSNIWLAAFFWGTSSALASFEIAQILGFRMRVTPPELVGRVMGAVRLLVLAGIAPAILFFGWVADHRSPHVAMSISAAGIMVIALVTLCTPAIRNETR